MPPCRVRDRYNLSKRLINIRKSPMATAIISSEGQTTIPQEIRELLGLQSGDRIDFIVEADGRVYLEMDDRITV